MKSFKHLFLISILFTACTKNSEQKKSINLELAAELAEMIKNDQFAATNAFPPAEYKNLSQDDWNAKKDSIYRSHTIRMEQILNQYGYPGFDIVGKEGESNFWIMVQHSDFDPSFQNRVLKKLKVEVDKENADPKNFALLTDRVLLNEGKKQIYGTQVFYNTSLAQALPKPLFDSLNVNERRKIIGLEPIETYLNSMSTMHFRMNRSRYLEVGITEPKLLKIE